MNSDEVSIGAMESDVCRRNISVGCKLQNTVGLKTLFIHNSESYFTSVNNQYTARVVIGSFQGSTRRCKDNLTTYIRFVKDFILGLLQLRFVKL